MTLNKSKKLILPLILLTLGLTVFFVPAAHAQLDAWGGQANAIQEGTGLTSTDPRVVVANVIRVILGFLGLVALGLILYSGFLWMTSEGDTTKIEKAKKILSSAVIGLIIILSSFAIATFVISKLLGSTIGGGGPCIDGVVGGTCCGGTGNMVCTGGVFVCDSSFCSPPPPVTQDNLVSCGSTFGSCEATTTCLSLATDSFCNQNNCLCTPKGGLGAGCNSTTTPICSADNDRCMTGLTCSPTNCKCEGPPIIDYVSPVGGFCLDAAKARTNSACLIDSDCSSISPAAVCATSTPNGAPGNFVTIGGRFFGTSTGVVEFNHVAAQLAVDVNPTCKNSWANNRVIAIVPGTATSGPIKLARAIDPADGGIVWSDTTDNAPNAGPMIEDFWINTIQRPGLCSIYPLEDVAGKSITYYGINLLGAKAFFGNYQNNVVGGGSAFTDNIAGFSTVPNIKAGKTSTYAQVGSTTSNFFDFKKLDDDKKNRYITSFGPIRGKEGQYVTIHGVGFGWASVLQMGDTHRVYLDEDVFDNLTSSGEVVLTNLGVEVDYSFPADCAENLWGDKQIIIKVPKSKVVDGKTIKLTDGQDYSVVIYAKIGKNEWIIDSSELSSVTSLNISPTFTYDPTTALSPGLCRIAPMMGMPGITPVAMYGEYFGPNASGQVQFSNILMSGFSGTEWKINNAGNNADKIATTVPTSAATPLVTGAVNVLQGANSRSNGLDFAIGSCLDAGSTQVERNTACGGYTCCANGSPKAGRCEATADDCFKGPKTSVYEWEFDTGVHGNQPTSTPGSCGGYDLNQCVDSIFCPNSPGQCSPYGGGTGVLNTEVSCESVNSAGLSYNKDINRYASTSQSCTLSTTTKDIFNKPVNTYCAIFQNVQRVHFKTKLSCPVGWTMTLGACVNTNSTCNLCDKGFDCFATPLDNVNGVCAVDKLVCPSGASCNTDKKCVKNDNPSCDCCCDIKPGVQDCCAGLTCEGSCGAGKRTDANGTDIPLGECGGCTQYDANGAVDQAASNNACNCVGTSGKFCETKDPRYKKGVCRDCQTLGQPDFCTNIGVGQCCVDVENGNKCNGYPGNKSIITNDNPDWAYCSYYDCASTGMNCNSLASTTGTYLNDNKCKGECAPTIQGRLCTGYATTTCAYDYCKDLYCLDKNGDLLGSCDPATGVCTAMVNGSPDVCTDGTCGNCCCDPTKKEENLLTVTGDRNPMYDKCNNIHSILECKPNITPCDDKATPKDPDYNKRGLCCGCSIDADCEANGVAVLNGCGSDTCCRQRPIVISKTPDDGSTSVCRNAKITATFDETMDANSFNNNVLVVGDYGKDVCPAGTQYLSKDGFGVNRNIFVRAYYKIIDFIEPVLPTLIVNALTPPDANYVHNYCAVAGTVSVHTNASDQGVMEFIPTKLYDADRLYYVIIKGDEKTYASGTAPNIELIMNSEKGVKSHWGIAMNDVSYNDPPALENKTFNGIVYPSAHVFSFKTLPDTAEGGGVCKVAGVKIEPTSYLFKTNKDDITDNTYGNGTNNDFDKIKDSDKVFVADAYSADGQILFGVPNFYNWEWGFAVQNNSVASIITITGLPLNQAFVQAKPDVTDDKTILSATSTIIADTVFKPSTDGTTKNAKANIYVFVCDNPWPPISPLGIWSPWVDTAQTGSKCTTDNQSATPSIVGTCQNTNFEIYYCRDAGGPGTFDDLPAIANNDGIIRGKTNNELLKEVYFFGEGKTEAVPSSIFALNNPAANDGGSALVSWTAAANTEYKVYWGVSSGKYTDSATTTNSPFIVNNLTNDTVYYFNVASTSGTGVESELLNKNDASLLVKDIKAPASPVLSVDAVSTGVKVKWQAVTAASNYDIYYGLQSGSYGRKLNTRNLEIVIPNLKVGTKYYFAGIAIDDYGNLSATSTPVMEAIPLP